MWGGANGYRTGRHGKETRWRRPRRILDGGPGGARVASGRGPIIDWCERGISRGAGRARVNPKGRAGGRARNEARGNPADGMCECALRLPILRPESDDARGREMSLTCTRPRQPGERTPCARQGGSEREAFASWIGERIQVRWGQSRTGLCRTRRLPENDHLRSNAPAWGKRSVVEEAPGGAPSGREMKNARGLPGQEMADQTKKTRARKKTEPGGNRKQKIRGGWEGGGSMRRKHLTRRRA